MIKYLVEAGCQVLVVTTGQYARKLLACYGPHKSAQRFEYT